jgi:enamine deaminase RidA (YjgF/YER057c/UK114 family)
MPGAVDGRLAELGLEIPDPAAPAANYVGHVVTGNLVFVAGQLPIEDGQIVFTGKLGADVSLEDGQTAARLCAINIVAQLKKACGGDLDRVRRIVKLGAFVNSTADFGDQPEVVNGASDLIVAIFGDKGLHARAAVSAGALPRNVAVEIDAVVEID